VVRQLQAKEVVSGEEIVEFYEDHDDSAVMDVMSTVLAELQ